MTLVGRKWDANWTALGSGEVQMGRKMGHWWDARWDARGIG
jgi:hypothetical protein